MRESERDTLSKERNEACVLDGARFLELGTRDFSEWSGAMLNSHGENLRPHLEAIYLEAVRLFNQVRTDDAPPAGRSSYTEASVATPGGADLPIPKREERSSFLGRVGVVVVAVAVVCLTFPYYDLPTRENMLGQADGYRFFFAANGRHIDWSQTVHGFLWLSVVSIAMLWLWRRFAHRSPAPKGHTRRWTIVTVIAIAATALLFPEAFGYGLGLILVSLALSAIPVGIHWLSGRTLSRAQFAATFVTALVIVIVLSVVALVHEPRKRKPDAFDPVRDLVPVSVHPEP